MSLDGWSAGIAGTLALSAWLVGCLGPECPRPPVAAHAPTAEAPSAPPLSADLDTMAELDAWTAASRMSPGINIGNTLENTTQWETGWGNPPITRELVQSLAALGFKTVRVPVAWDTFAVGGRIQPDKLSRVGEVVDFVLDAGLFAVVNIHWDGGWIDSGVKEKFPDTYATFSPVAEQKYRSYWTQIASHFAGKNERLLFEALNEETKFENEGSPEKAFATLTRVNQLFIDTVRATGGNNEKRLLIVTGYHTDFTKTCSEHYVLPKDTLPHKLFLSVHYYTPWPFCGMTKDESWGKMAPTWGSVGDFAELERLFDMMGDYAKRHDIPVFLGEYGASHEKEVASRARFMAAVTNAAHARKMVPVLWDTGHDISRRPPHAPSAALRQMLDAFPSKAPPPG
jgi:endoglucanase